MRKKLLRLEAAFQVVRHITGPYVQNLMAELDTMLASGGLAAGVAGSRSGSSSSSDGSPGDGGDGCGSFYFGELFLDAEVQTEVVGVNDAFGLDGDSLEATVGAGVCHRLLAARGGEARDAGGPGGGPVYCHRLSAARGGEARDAGGPGGGPTGIHGHDNDEDELNQEGFKVHVSQGHHNDDEPHQESTTESVMDPVPEVVSGGLVDHLPEFGSGGPVGRCGHRLTAVRGGKARGAAGPGGGPTGSPGHDNEGEHNQKSSKKYVMDGTTAGPDEAAGNGVRLEEEAGNPRTERRGNRSAWADVEDSEAEFDANQETMHRDTEDNGVQVVGFDELNEAVLFASGGEAAPCSIQVSTSLEGTFQDHHDMNDFGFEPSKATGGASATPFPTATAEIFEATATDSAREGSRPMAAAPQAAASAAAAEAAGRPECRPSRVEGSQKKKKKSRRPQFVHPVGDRFFWVDDLAAVCRVRGRGPDNEQGATYTVRTYDCIDEDQRQWLGDTTDEEIDFQQNVPHHKLFEEGSPRFAHGYRVVYPDLPWEEARSYILRSCRISEDIAIASALQAK
jgi:hypothetical protein